MDLERLVEFLERRRNPLLATTLLVAGAGLLWGLLPVLAPFLISFVLAYVLAPLVTFMRRLGTRRWHPSRMSCVLTIYVAFFGAVIGFGIPLVANLASGMIHMATHVETADLQNEAGGLVRRYEEALLGLPLPAQVGDRVKAAFSDPKDLSRVLVAATEKGRAIVTAVLRGGAKFLSKVVGASVSLMLVPILLFYFLLEYDDFYEKFMHTVPVPYRDWMERFLGKVDVSLGGFVRGQLLIAFLFGLIMTVGLWLIGIRYAIILGPLSGVANLVPYLGVVVGLVPAFFLALWQGGLSFHALYLCASILLLFVFLQLLDGYVFQPRILGPSVDLHPLTIMLALALGEHAMGLAGMMLAVPVAAVLRVILEELHPVLYGTEA